MTDDRRHTEQGNERKQQLVHAAEQLFTQKGYGATRISDICAAAGVAKGLFYWYFPTKQSLFGELVRTMRLSLRRAQAAAMDPTADPVTRIRQGAEASVRFMAEHQMYFALLDVERTDEALSPVMREGSDVYATDVCRLIEAAQRDGLVQTMSISSNLLLTSIPQFTKNGVVRKELCKKAVNGSVKDMQIKVADVVVSL